MTVAVLAALLLATPALARIPAHKQAWQYRYRVWMPPMWIRLAHCESGTRPPSDPDWKHDSGDYEGGFGYWVGTWTRYRYAGYPAHAYQATPWMQYRVALRLFRLYGYSPWGCFRHAWVRYG